jgi:hypothetical protein
MATVKKNNRFRWVRRILMPVLLLTAIIAVSWYAFSDAAESAERQQYDNMLRRVNQAITACYAIEGRYPPSFAHLTEHYGIRVDESRFTVIFDVPPFSNIRPFVDIRPIGNQDGSGGDANGG